MKRIQSVEISLQDIVEKFKIKNVANLKAVMTGVEGNLDNEGFEVNADTARLVLSFETVKADKVKKTGGRPRKVKPVTDAAASNGAAPASA